MSQRAVRGQEIKLTLDASFDEEREKSRLTKSQFFYMTSIWNGRVVRILKDSDYDEFKRIS